MSGSTGVGTGPGVSSGRSFRKPATTRGAGDCSPTSIASHQHCTNNHYSTTSHKTNQNITKIHWNNPVVRNLFTLECQFYFFKSNCQNSFFFKTSKEFVIIARNTFSFSGKIVPTTIRPAGVSMNELSWFEFACCCSRVCVVSLSAGLPHYEKYYKTVNAI